MCLSKSLVHVQIMLFFHFNSDSLLKNYICLVIYPPYDFSIFSDL